MKTLLKPSYFVEAYSAKEKIFQGKSCQFYDKKVKEDYNKKIKFT